jgi:hypothetical protein
MMIDLLPIDCKTKIISYLPLYDVLEYSSTSKASLYNAILDIHHRKKRMKMSFHWDGKKIMPHEQNYISSNYTSTSTNTAVHACSSNTSTTATTTNSYSHSQPNLLLLPSILDRIQSLYQNVSSSHSMRDLMYELITTLKKDDEREIVDVEEEIKGGGEEEEEEEGKVKNNFNFNSLFQSLQSLLKVHKLHTMILKSSIYSNVITNGMPYKNDTSNRNSSNNEYNWHRIYDNGNAINLHLDQYLGDVYIANIFMGNISSGLVEGVSERKWLHSIQSNMDAQSCHPNPSSVSACSMSNRTRTPNSASNSTIGNTNVDLNVNTTFGARVWYQSWIFLHSTILRTIQLTNEERDQFGILMNGNILKQRKKTNQNDDVEMNIMIPPILPFQGLFKTKTMLHMYRNLDCDGLLSAVLRDFGPLGPSFRGR